MQYKDKSEMSAIRTRRYRAKIRADENRYKEYMERTREVQRKYREKNRNNPLSKNKCQAQKLKAYLRLKKYREKKRLEKQLHKIKIENISQKPNEKDLKAFIQVSPIEIEYVDNEGYVTEFDDDISDEERKFYLKIYPLVDNVASRKVHCTVCDEHIGTAPCQKTQIYMHPILKVTHCKKCYDFYNSGEFSKGDDGSELYCRWCGQGGEVYCCSKCPYVFCKSCILVNFSQTCVNDIEENENWNCFVCAPKIMWHLRAQHWALMQFIEKQRKKIMSSDVSDIEMSRLLKKDSCTCCLSKNKMRGAKLETPSDVSDTESISKKKGRNDKKLKRKISTNESEDSLDTTLPEVKKKKNNNNSNDEVVCTPDVMSMLQTEISPTSNVKQVTLQTTKQATTSKVSGSQQKSKLPTLSPSLQITTKQKLQQIRQQQIRQQTQTQAVSTQSYPQQVVISPNIQNTPPPLVIRSYTGPVRASTPTTLTRKSVVGARPPSATPGHTPIYHTINGYRIDLNSAAQQDTFRLPNGKLIQVKRQGPPQTQASVNQPSVLRTAQLATRPVTIQPQQQPQSFITHNTAQGLQHYSIQQPQLATIRYATAPNQQVISSGNTTSITIPTQAGTVVLNGTGNVQQIARAAIQAAAASVAANNPTTTITTGPTLSRHIFPTTPEGQARTQLQTQIFTAMEICQYLVGKIHSLTNSNAYKTAKNFNDVNELYIHFSYLITYGVGRFKSLNEKCIEDMRKLGFTGNADSLQSGQLVSQKNAADEGDDGDIEIVEPKTTCIDLDSDDEDAVSQKTSTKQQPNTSTVDKTPEKDLDSSTGLLAGMLEVELHEGNETTNAISDNNSNSSSSSGLKKPRFKTTNKPNPHLLEMQQREKEEMKKQKSGEELNNQDTDKKQNDDENDKQNNDKNSNMGDEIAQNEEDNDEEEEEEEKEGDVSNGNDEVQNKDAKSDEQSKNQIDDQSTKTQVNDEDIVNLDDDDDDDNNTDKEQKAEANENDNDKISNVDERENQEKETDDDSQENAIEKGENNTENMEDKLNDSVVTISSDENENTEVEKSEEEATKEDENLNEKQEQVKDNNTDDDDIIMIPEDIAKELNKDEKNAESKAVVDQDEAMEVDRVDNDDTVVEEIEKKDNDDTNTQDEPVQSNQNDKEEKEEEEEEDVENYKIISKQQDNEDQNDDTNATDNDGNFDSDAEDFKNISEQQENEDENDNTNANDNDSTRHVEDFKIISEQQDNEDQNDDTNLTDNDGNLDSIGDAEDYKDISEQQEDEDENGDTNATDNDGNLDSINSTADLADDASKTQDSILDSISDATLTDYIHQQSKDDDDNDIDNVVNDVIEAALGNVNVNIDNDIETTTGQTTGNDDLISVDKLIEEFTSGNILNNSRLQNIDSAGDIVQNINTEDNAVLAAAIDSNDSSTLRDHILECLK